MVVSVGIDVSKDKHDCFIVSAEGEVLADVFTVPNNMDGFQMCIRDRDYGARPLRRVIQNQVEDPISEKMLEGTVTANKAYSCDYRDGKFTFEAVEGTETPAQPQEHE